MYSEKVRISIYAHCNTLKLQALKFIFVLFAPFCGYIKFRI